MLTDFHWLTAGHCKAIEAFTIKNGAWRWKIYPAKFALFRHPTEGWCLFDTGYAPRFLEATSRLPYKLYEWVTPVSIESRQTVRSQIREFGLRAQDIKTIFVSHLHADHVAGLLDFPLAEIVTTREGYDALSPLTGLSAVRKGFLPQLLPLDFEARARWVDGVEDLFGDRSVLKVALPGHATGQFGVRLNTEGGEIFLCADACWHSRSYREGLDLPWYTHLLLTADSGAFHRSLKLLVEFHRAHPNVPILPSHCEEAYPFSIDQD